MVKEQIPGFGEFELYENYFIGRIYEGVDAGAKYVEALTVLVQKHFSGRPVIYISDRVNSYSLDPVATIDLINRNNIRFVAIVMYTPKQRAVYPYEEQFITGTNLCSFTSLDDALVWAEQKSTELADK